MEFYKYQKIHFWDENVTLRHFYVKSVTFQNHYNNRHFDVWWQKWRLRLFFSHFFLYKKIEISPKKNQEFQDKWHIRSKVKKSVTNVTFVTNGQNVSYMVIFKGDTFEIDVSQSDILISNCRDKSDVCDSFFHTFYI